MKTYVFYYKGGKGKVGNIIPDCENLLNAITYLTPSKLYYLTKIEIYNSLEEAKNSIY